MDKKGAGLVLATAIISGFSVWLNSYGVKGLDAAFFTTAKNVLVALLLVITILALREWRSIAALSQRQWKMLALIGLVGGSVPFVLFFTGLKMSTAATGSLIRTSMLVFVILFATLFLKERASKGALVGSVLLVLGSALLSKLQGFSFGYGELLILLATILWAAEIALSKRALAKIPSRVVALGRMGFGAAFLLSYLVFTQKLALFSATSTGGWWWIILTAALLYGYVFTFYEGLGRVPAITATAVLMLGPVITVVLVLASTGKITGLQVVGSALAIAGVLILSIWQPSPNQEPRPQSADGPR